MGEGGFDPFLEDSQTLWLIHWNFSTHSAKSYFRLGFPYESVARNLR